MVNVIVHWGAAAFGSSGVTDSRWETRALVIRILAVNPSSAERARSRLRFRRINSTGITNDPI